MSDLFGGDAIWQVAIAQETEVKINEAREEYRGVANRGALLFFALGEMFKVRGELPLSLSLSLISCCLVP